MSRKRFNGVRVRVEGERAQYASRAVAERGYTIKQEGRLGDDTGYIIRTVEGPVIHLYDTGSIVLTGNGRREFGSVDEMRLPNESTGVLILKAEDESPRNLIAMLDGWDVPHQHARFSDGDWMGTVAAARRRGLHIVVVVSTSQALRNSMSDQADPRVYFGIGLIVARISRDHFTVICRDDIQMPQREHLLGTEIIRYARQIDEIKPLLQQRFRRAGVLAGGVSVTGQQTLAGMNHQDP